MSIVVKTLKTGDLTIHLEYLLQGEKITKHGDFTGYYSSGKKAITGSYISGKPNGKWSRWYENEKLASVHHYVLGALEGDYVQFYENGDKAREGNYIKGKPEGEHHIYFKNNKVEKRFKYKRGKIRHAEFLVGDRPTVFDYVGGIRLLNGDKYKYKKVCSLRDTGQLICKTPAQIIEDLSTMADPDYIRDILNYFDRLYEELMLDNNKDILVGCAGGVLAMPTDKSGADPVPQTANRNLNRAPMTQTEIDSIFSACSSTSRGVMGLDSGVPDADKRRDSFVQDTVAEIDEQVSNCRETSNDMIAMGPAALVAACAANPLCANLVGGAVGGAIVSFSTLVVNEAMDDGFGEVIDSKADPEVSYYKNNNEIVKEEYNDGRVIITQPTGSFEPGVTKKTIHYSDETSQTVFFDKDKNAIRIDTFDSDNNMVKTEMTAASLGPNVASPLLDEEDLPDGDLDLDPAPAPTPGQSPTPPPTIPDTDQSVMGRCERMATWWNAKKAACEKSHWQTYDCEQILRVANGCVDSALIKPSPDGSLTCAQRKGMSQEEAREEDCKRRSGIMVPDGFGNEQCESRENLQMPEKDICSDPRAMCLPDQLLPEDEMLGRERGRVGRNFNRVAATIENHAALTNESSMAFRHLRDEDFDEYIGSAKNPLVVVFGAANCPPCKRVLRHLDDLESELSTKVETCYVEVPQNPRVAHTFDIKYTPTILVFEKGKAIAQRRVGAATKDVLLKYVERNLRACLRRGGQGIG